MPRAIRVTNTNVRTLIQTAEKQGFNLGHLLDNLKYAQEFGQQLYLITDGSTEKNNVTFTDMWGTDFQRNWQFKTAPSLAKYTEIIRL